MRIRSCISNLLKKFDLFAISQFLRYQDDNDFKTASGGIFSILIITVFLVLFMNTAIETINKQIINWTATTSNYLEPTHTNITFGQNSSFMFTVGIMGLNLNNPLLRYFDITLIEHHYQAGGIEIGGNTVALQPCTKQHFAVSAQLEKSYDVMPAKRWLCAPINYTYEFYGKYTSKEMKFLQVNVKKCTNSSVSSRPCASDTVIDHLQTNLGQFTLSFFYINPLINPGNINYLDYYFQDKNYLTFTRQLGAYSNGFVQDYSIETDESLLPFSDNRIDRGVIIPEVFQNIIYQVTNDNYASFYLLKSGVQTDYNRSFNKLDVFFSYIGGLVGTILGFMLFMGNFTEMAFQLNLANKLFRYNSEQNSNFSNFNLFHYILYLIYGIGSRFKYFSNWSQMKKRQQCRNQIVKQLDIGFILKRFNFFERTISDISNKLEVQMYNQVQLDLLSKIKFRRKMMTNKMREREIASKESSKSSSSFDESQQQSQNQNKSNNNKVNNQSILRVGDSQAIETSQKQLTVMYPLANKSNNNSAKRQKEIQPKSKRKRDKNAIFDGEIKNIRPEKVEIISNIQQKSQQKPSQQFQFLPD